MQRMLLGIALVIVSFLSGWAVRGLERNQSIVHAYGENKEPSDLEKSALLGSRAASQKLSREFERCAISAKKVPGQRKSICAKKSDLWLEINAQNGDTFGASALANNLISSNKCRDVLRGRFWAGKVEAAGVVGSYIDSAERRIREVCT